MVGLYKNLSCRNFSCNFCKRIALAKKATEKQLIKHNTKKTTERENQRAKSDSLIIAV